jgi:hypothetical protein
MHHVRGRCDRTGKMRWETRAGARDQVRHLRAIGGRDVESLGTYRCVDGCGDWHVGHRR